MTVAHVSTIQPTVTGGHVIAIEADLSRGLHSFTIVGSPVKRSKKPKIVSQAPSNTPVFRRLSRKITKSLFHFLPQI